MAKIQVSGGVRISGFVVRPTIVNDYILTVEKQSETEYVLRIKRGGEEQTVNMVSPHVETEEIEDGVRVTVTDANGEKTFELHNGQDGKDGGIRTVNGVEPDEDGNVEVSGLPTGQGAYKQLVTDASGAAVWEDKPFGEMKGWQATLALEERAVTTSDGKRKINISGMLDNAEVSALSEYPNVKIQYGSETYYDKVREGQTSMQTGGLLIGDASLQTMPFLIEILTSSYVKGYTTITVATQEDNIEFGLWREAEVTVKIPRKYVDVEGFGAAGTGDQAEIYNGTYDKEAGGTYSHAEGYRTHANGNMGSHAEGRATHANGLSSHAEGDGTQANGDYSHAEGSETQAHGLCQHVEGCGNEIDNEDKYLHIVGNGQDAEHRSNAHTLDWSGNAWFAGKIKVGGSGQDDADAKTMVQTVNGQEADENGNVTVAAGPTMILINGMYDSSTEKWTLTCSHTLAQTCALLQNADPVTVMLIAKKNDNDVYKRYLDASVAKQFGTTDLCTFAVENSILGVGAMDDGNIFYDANGLQVGPPSWILPPS